MCFDLCRQRIPVVRRSTLQDVGDVDVITTKRDGLQNLVEELAGSSHERLTLLIFIRPGGLADDQ